MRTAIIHEWLVTLAGAESVLQSIYKLYPGTIYTLFHDPQGIVGAPFADAPIYMSMLQRLPFGKKHHRAFLPLYPMAIEQFDLRDQDLVISSSYAVAKGCSPHRTSFTYATATRPCATSGTSRSSTWKRRA